MTKANVTGKDNNVVSLNMGYDAATNKAEYSFLVSVDPDTKDISVTCNGNGVTSDITVNGIVANTVKMGDTNVSININDTTTTPATSKSYSLTYDKDGKISITDNDSIPNETVSITAKVTKDADGNNKVSIDDEYMNSLTITGNYPSNTDDAAYKSVIGDDNANNITYIASSGEILLGSAVQNRLSNLSSDTQIRVTYDKSEWQKDDLDPIHYFYTQKNGIEYNENFLEDPTASGKQIIEYDIGNNQSIRVNTTADEVFTHDMGRDADEVIEMLNEYSSIEDSLSTVQSLIDSEQYKDGDLTKLETEKAALEKAKTFIGDKINSRCSALLTDCDNYAERTQLAETNCGSRGSRLDLIKNRLSVQQTNFEELVSENEDADYTDLAIQLKSIELTYEAALSSISYVMQTTLLDFI
jgi:flagellar hook-associated protein 3 FlgL